MVPATRTVLFGRHDSRFQRVLDGCFAVGLSIATFASYALEVFQVSGGVIVLPADASLVGFVAAVGIGARLVHHLPYYYARTDLTTENGGVRFRSRRLHPGSRPVHFRATYEPAGEEFTPEVGSLPEFLTDRYRYYTESQEGGVRYADVSHEPWPLYEAAVGIEENSLFEANGFDHPRADPVHLYSPGVDTVASRSRRL